ncbi:hypothetical protein COLO4_24858 [Corchorus olitorius]|uniref:Uncharacterized protein n=1 Tax=Corchorus olitorius TaxID=93759 RepID=A0A1R3I6C6_9ROSI|nr:hypothetical protein COLO4_24858 [Corchorus olitorius]
MYGGGGDGDAGVETYRHMEEVVKGMVVVETCKCMEVVGMEMEEVVTYRHMEEEVMEMEVEGTCRHKEEVVKVMVVVETCKCMEVVGMEMEEVETCIHKVEVGKAPVAALEKMLLKYQIPLL